MSAKPFTVGVPDTVLGDLRDRLARTRWPDQIKGSGWDYGTDTAYLKRLVGHWRAFDWRAQERRINGFDHFRATVDGVGLHFIHARGEGAGAVPVLLLHGWPGSFLQMLDLIPLLTREQDGLSFDVVAASLPGYGFSDIPGERGMSGARMARLFTKLITETLGYDRFAGRAGDLGAGVLQQIAVTSPERMIGFHTGGTNPYVQEVPEDLSPAEKRFVEQAQQWTQQEMAYAMLHGSKPQTLAHALNDSPAGLASWIVEKFWRWGDVEVPLEQRFDRDALLANLTLYWVTGTIGSSMRLYYETMRDPGKQARVEVPTAMLMSAKDMFPTPREWVERTSRVDRWTEIDRGGHFLEQEEPELVAKDMRAFFGGLGQGQG